MNKTKVKICGVKETSTIDCCINNQVDYFGLIFYEKSPRNTNLENALKLINYVKFKKITPVGVFVDRPINELKDIINKTHLNYIQLHGNESMEYINILKNEYDLKIIKSIGIKEKADFKKTEKLSNADYFLFDYKPQINELPGGNAMTFDWSLLKNIKISKPWFISGGININNVKEIYKNQIPYGIDISSGVEEKLGIKSSRRITDLMKILNA